MFGCSCIGLQATPAPVLLEQRAAGACPALHRLQLVSSPVACSLLMLQASWDMATAERMSALSCVELMLG